MVELVKDDAVALYGDFDERFQAKDARLGIEREAVTSIPVIDFGPFMTESSLAARKAVAQEIRTACIDIGFFYLANHGIPAAELDETARQALRFFELPPDKKETLYKDKAGPGGIMRIGADLGDKNPDKASDLKEVYGMQREVLAGEPQTGRMGVGQTLWPPEDWLPGWRGFMQATHAKRTVIAQRLARAFALSLGLAETELDPIHKYMGGNFVLNYYPTFKGTRLPTQWSISPHSDYGTYTLLSQDALGGLQVRNAGGVWIDVPPIPGTFVVNIGDLMAVWTNDLYLPSLHRALNTANVPRISAPLFCYPHGSTMIECLPTCQSASNPALYDPRTAEAHVSALVAQSRRTGRPGITTRTARRFQPAS